MFNHTQALQFEAKPDNPDALYAAKLQELLGGAYGEMTVAMQYLFQGWNARIPGKYKDMILDIGTEELAHVEMIAIMIARLLEHAPSDDVAKAAAANPALAAVLGGQNPQQAIISGGGPLLADSMGNPWQGSYIVASGNLLADFHANATAEYQGRLQTARLYGMTDDQGVKNMLSFNLARDTMHQNQWLKAIQMLEEDGLERTPVPWDTEELDNPEFKYAYVKYSDGPDSLSGGWANGPTPDGQGEFTALDHPEPMGGVPGAIVSDPKLYTTAAEESARNKTGGPSVVDAIKDKLS